MEIISKIIFDLNDNADYNMLKSVVLMIGKTSPVERQERMFLSEQEADSVSDFYDKLSKTFQD